MPLVAKVCALPAIEEVRGRWHADVKRKRRQHGALHLQNVVLRIRVVGDVSEFGNFGRSNLLEFGRNEHCNDADELKALPYDGRECHVAIDEVDREVQRLGPKAILHVDLDEPIHKDRPHRAVGLFLQLHVIRSGHVGPLLVEHVAEYFLRVLAHALDAVILRLHHRRPRRRGRGLKLRLLRLRRRPGKQCHRCCGVCGRLRRRPLGWRTSCVTIGSGGGHRSAKPGRRMETVPGSAGSHAKRHPRRRRVLNVRYIRLACAR
mmetsp:Transcript_15432/g.42428  ORF Transcript_15432/g.42428 Transcript_15432/m.42428 type:complete len:262 (+) Transcript_15432:335-1120(+)